MRKIKFVFLASFIIATFSSCWEDNPSIYVRQEYKGGIVLGRDGDDDPFFTILYKGEVIHYVHGTSMDGKLFNIGDTIK